MQSMKQYLWISNQINKRTKKEKGVITSREKNNLTLIDVEIKFGAT
jgi:hypothetical protein